VELVASEDDRDSCEGNTLKEMPTGGCGTKQGREVRLCQETAERLEKPESGTEVSLGRLASYGARSSVVVERCGNPGKSSPAGIAGQSKGGEKLCRGARSKAE